MLLKNDSTFLLKKFGEFIYIPPIMKWTAEVIDVPYDQIPTVTYSKMIDLLACEFEAHLMRSKESGGKVQLPQKTKLKLQISLYFSVITWIHKQRDTGS